MYFTITIDTEADNAWDHPENIQLKNFSEIPRFQELCEKYGIIPSYLLSYEYASYKPAIEYLKPKLEDNKCEIGHHLHVWTTPPFSDEKNGIDKEWVHAYQFELPDDLFEAKSACLHDEITKNFGQAPRSHRAGRWGLDDRTLIWLKKNDYVVDTSIVPKMNWNSNKGQSALGPDFSQESIYPKLHESSNIIEVPVSVNFPQSGFVRRYLKDHDSQVKCGLKRKLLNKFNLNAMLRPNPKYDLKYYDKFINKLMKAEMPVINMMLHSSELAFQCSPYTRTSDDHERIWAIIERVFKLIHRSDYEPKSLTICAKNLENDKWTNQNIQY